MIHHLTQKTLQGKKMHLCRNPLLRQIKRHKVGLRAKGITQVKAIPQRLSGLLMMRVWAPLALLEAILLQLLAMKPMDYQAVRLRLITCVNTPSLWQTVIFMNATNWERSSSR